MGCNWPKQIRETLKQTDGKVDPLAISRIPFEWGAGMEFSQGKAVGSLEDIIEIARKNKERRAKEKEGETP